MSTAPDVLDTMVRLREAGEAFVLATVVRTVSLTAAKAGAKAIIRPDGTISEGWIGGGCARGAVLKAAKEALADGRPRLVSVQPEEMLGELGVRNGEVREGVRFAHNHCASRGTIDVFVEPILPRPQLLILGASPVAVALADLAPRLGFETTVAAPAAEQAAFAEADRRIEGYRLDDLGPGRRFVVVSTQGRGDEAALRSALEASADYVAFVGSRRKVEALREALVAAGASAEAFDRLHAPAGLDIGGATPTEIALSILAEIVEVRRRGAKVPLKAVAAA